MLAGNLVFHGPRGEVVPYFQSLGFFIPERKAVSDFLQEVTSQKDQKVVPLLPFPALMPGLHETVKAHEKRGTSHSKSKEGQGRTGDKGKARTGFAGRNSSESHGRLPQASVHACGSCDGTCTSQFHTCSHTGI